LQSYADVALQSQLSVDVTNHVIIMSTQHILAGHSALPLSFLDTHALIYRMTERCPSKIYQRFDHGPNM